MEHNRFMVNLHWFLLALVFFTSSVNGQCQTNTKCECALAGGATKTASSSLSPAFFPNQSGINNAYDSIINNGTETIINGGSWQPSVEDSSPLFILDFGSDKTIRKINTKGNAHYDYWVKKYDLYRKATGEASYYHVKRLNGNSNGNGGKSHDFGDNTQFRARYLKIKPIEFEKNISLRIEVTGCDKVDGAWTNWGSWRSCRAPCGGGKKYRFRSCKDPEPKFLGDYCPGSNFDTTTCHTDPCPPSSMALELELTDETWDDGILINPTPVCDKLKTNLSAVYVPPGLEPFVTMVVCSFFKIGVSGVGVTSNITFNTSSGLYIVKLQDGLYYKRKISAMGAILRKYTSSLVPYPPNVISYESPKHTEFRVKRSAATEGPSTFSFESFYRLETTDPDGEWSYRGIDTPYGSCDFTADWCYVWGTHAFHNYSVRIVPFNVGGYGFGADPYRVTTLEDKPAKPTNFRGNMISSKSIIVRWSAVPLSEMKGNSEGYILRYTRQNRNEWRNIAIPDHWTLSYTLTGLDEYWNYLLKLRSKNRLHQSDWTGQIVIRTDEDIPTAPPNNVQNSAHTSTQLRVTWGDVPEEDRNGNFINFKIKVVLGQAMKDQGSYIVTAYGGGTREKVIVSLVKWTYYTIQVAATTSKGTGPYSSAKTTRTHEDRPTAAPGNLRGVTTSSTELKFSWDLILLASRHGVITQYQLQYCPVNNPGSVNSAYFNGAGTVEGIISGLAYWTEYNVKVAARTTVGYGPFSTGVVLRTQEHPPTRSPENFHGVNTSSYSIRINWNEVTVGYRHGIILGYTVQHKSSRDATWSSNINYGKNNRSLEISGLFNFTLYTFKVAAFNTKGNGVEANIQVRTDDATPTLSPASVTARNTSSTSLLVAWQRIPEISRHGIILGYMINYTDLVFNTRLTVTKNNWGSLQITLGSLDKYRYYRIDIAGYTKKGLGPFISTTAITDEDRPSVAPTGLNGTAPSATTVNLTWNLLPVIPRNGIITHYRVHYIALFNPIDTGVFVYSGGATQQGQVSSLHYWTYYNFSVAARTRIGYGVYSEPYTLRTQEHVPTRPPINFSGSNTSSYSINITWDPIESQYRHGIILGYNVTYKSKFDAGILMVDVVGRSNLTTELRNLRNYTHYNISVAGYNSKGDGSFAKITVRTEETEPSKSPASLISYNTSSTSLWVEWQKIPFESRRGIILGYVLIYHDVRYNITRNLTFHHENILSHNLTGLDEFREYRISLAGFTKVGIGPFVVVNAVTDEDIPAAAPAKIYGHFASSSELSISWSQPPDQDQNGRIQTVNVFYKIDIRSAPTRAIDGLAYFKMLEEKRNKTASSNSSSLRKRRSFQDSDDVLDVMKDARLSKCIEILSNVENSEHVVFENLGLQSVLDFCIGTLDVENIAKSYTAGESSDVSQRTESSRFDVLVNNHAPSYLASYISQHNSHGSEISQPMQLSQFASYSQSKSSRRRMRRSSSPPAGFSTVVVNANESSVKLNSLDPYMNYTIMLQATTKKGVGPISSPILVETGEAVPNAPPQSIFSVNTSSTSLLVTWQPVPYSDANGVVYAYIVSIKRAQSNESWVNYTQYEPVLQMTYTGLLRYVVYTIKVSAVTSRGSGPFSTEVLPSTDQDIPSAAPANVTGESITSKLLRIKWKPVPGNGVPSCCVHGVLTGYKVWWGKRYPVPGDSTTMITLPPSRLTLDIANLVTFTPYTIDVAAMTSKGHGPKGRVHLWTSEDKPILEPQNVTIVNSSSTSLQIEWNELPFMLRKGEIRGYAVYYRVTKSSHALSVNWVNMDKFTGNYTVVYTPAVRVETDDVIKRLTYELTGLYKFMDYTVHLTAYTKAGTGPWTFAHYAKTDEDVPSMAGVNVSAISTSSTSILVSWDLIPVIYDPTIADPICCVHGILTGYTIFYTRITKTPVHNVTIDLSYFKRNVTLIGNLHANETSNSTRMNYTLTGLDMHKNYTIYVAGNTRKGHGVLGQPVYVRTDEDLPAREPADFKSWNTSSTSLHLEWDKIVWEYRNGYILYYTIYYRETLNPLQPWRAFNITASSNSTEIRNLRKWTFYDLRIYGATIVGLGLISANVTVRTDEDVPTMSPQNIHSVDYTGPYSLLLRWKPIPKEHRHGHILTYKVFYQKYSESDKIVKNSPKLLKIVPVNVNEVYLEYLSTFCTYKIQILGTTKYGDGLISQPIFAKTCRCIKHLYTSWWQIQPYTYNISIDGSKPSKSGVSDLSYIPKGIFGEFIKDMAIWGCQNCNGPRGHGYSVVHFDFDESGEKSMQSSEQGCINAASPFVKLVFPIQGRMLQKQFLSEGAFLPLLEYPLTSMVVLKKVTIISKNEAMKKSILSIWPLVLINMLFAVASGFVLWVLDSSSNPEEFPPSVFEGMWSGFWWAYITMTTVGYGDLTPRSFQAKVFSIAWTLMGLCLYAILGSALTSALYVKEQIIIENVRLYNNKMAVVQGTFEEKIALLKGAIPVNKTSVPEVLTMVMNDEIQGALIDSYVLSLHGKFFDKTALYVQKTIKTNKYNYGVGLNGNLTKLKDVFTDFIHANQARLLGEVERYVEVKKMDKDSAVTQNGGSESPGMFQADSPVYKQIVNVISALIAGSVVFGLIYEIWRFRHKKKIKEENLKYESFLEENETAVSMEQLFEDANNISNNFVESVEKLLDEVTSRHETEILRLFNIHRYMNRREREGTDPRDSLLEYNIKVHDLQKVRSERERFKRYKSESWMKSMMNRLRWRGSDSGLGDVPTRFDSLPNSQDTESSQINSESQLIRNSLQTVDSSEA